LFCNEIKIYRNRTKISVYIVYQPPETISIFILSYSPVILLYNAYNISPNIDNLTVRLHSRIYNDFIEMDVTKMQTLDVYILSHFRKEILTLLYNNANRELNCYIIYVYLYIETTKCKMFPLVIYIYI